MRSSSSTMRAATGLRDIVTTIAERNPNVRCARSHLPPGFGHAVRAGLELYTGDAVAIMMADLSDSPKDLVLVLPRARAGLRLRFRHTVRARRRDPRTTRASSSYSTGLSTPGSEFLFQHGYNDTTNAFKAYRRHVIDQLQPLLSNHFNLTVELPLKAIVRGYHLRGRAGHLDQPAARRFEAAAAGDGQPVPVHRPLRVARAPSEPRRLSTARPPSASARKGARTRVEWPLLASDVLDCPGAFDHPTWNPLGFRRLLRL